MSTGTVASATTLLSKNITAMNQSKLEILAAAIASQKSIINDLQKRTTDIMANDGNVNEEEYDSTEQSIKSALIDEAEGLGDELAHARNELSDLEKLKQINERCTTVQPGAVVTTNRGIFFVSASIEEFNVGTSRFFGISPKAPLYQKMKGKKSGDKFKFGKMEYVIKHIY